MPRRESAIGERRSAAGESARATYERRVERHRQRVADRLSLIVARSLLIAGVGLVVLLAAGPTWQLGGWALVALSVLLALESILPGQSIRAWRIGADGEVATATTLADLESSDYVVLHDLKLPYENIDHVVVGPTGVWVVESKSYQGRLDVNRGNLVVAGRRRSGIAEQVGRQVDAVSSAVAGVPVHGVVCVHRAEFPLIRRLDLGGIPVVRPGQLRQTIESGRVALQPPQIEQIATTLAERFGRSRHRQPSSGAT